MFSAFVRSGLVVPELEEAAELIEEELGDEEAGVEEEATEELVVPPQPASTRPPADRSKSPDDNFLAFIF
jgi:hypothetical protein